jgi:hypothetical protein
LLKWAAKARRKNFLTAACKLLLYIAVACSNISHRIIFDARIGFEIKKGYAITFEFATINVVEKWPKMILPSSLELIQKVADMESDLVNRKIRMNFVFRDAIGSTNT